MSTNSAEHERKEFSDRLQQALQNAGYTPDSPTILAREFNLRFKGKPVTVHAARKWIIGESLPTQEKLQLVAQWLGVTPGWLRYGGQLTESRVQPSVPALGALSRKEVAILAGTRKLNSNQKKLIYEIVLELATNAGTEESD